MKFKKIIASLLLASTTSGCFQAEKPTTPIPSAVVSTNEVKKDKGKKSEDKKDENKDSSEESEENQIDESAQDIESPINQEFETKATSILVSNPFPKGQCTQFAWRMADEFGVKLQFSQNYGRNGGVWNILVLDLPRGTEPREKSIGVARSPKSKFGHVFWVDKIDYVKGLALIRESNWASPLKESSKWIPLSKLKQRGTYTSY